METESGEAPAGVADEVVDAPVKAIGELVVQLPEFKEFVDGLQLAYKAAHGVVFDLRTVRGNEDARRLRKQLVSARTSIEKRRIEQNQLDRSSIQERIARRDDGAAVLIDFVRSLEGPIDDQIRLDEERREREAEERRKAEEARIAALRQRVDDITAVAVRAVDLSSAEIQEKLALVGRIEIGEDFEEFSAAATTAKADTLSKLAELLQRAQRREAEAEQAERDRRELEQLRAQQAQRDAAERAEREQRQAAERAEAQRREAEAAAARRAEQEAAQRRQAQIQAAQDAVAEIQRAQRGALVATAAGVHEIIERIRKIAPTIDCGDFAGQWQYARDATVEQLTEMAGQKLEQEAQAEIDRKRRETEQRIAANFARLGVPPFAGEPHEIQAIEAKMAEIEAVVIDAESFGEGTELALSLKTGGMATLRERLAAAKAPRPAPVEPEPAPAVQVTIDNRSAEPVEAQVSDGRIELTVRTTGVEGSWDERDDPSFGGKGNVVDASFTPEIEHMLFGLLGVASTICRDAKPKSKAATEWIVSATLIDQLRDILPTVPLPGGQRYTRDGTLVNADGSRSIFDDVEQ